MRRRKTDRDHVTFYFNASHLCHFLFVPSFPARSMSNGSLPAGEGELLPLDAPDQPKSSGWRKRPAAQDFLDQHTTKRVNRRETPQSNASPTVSMASDPPMNYDRGQSSHPSTTNVNNSAQTRYQHHSLTRAPINVDQEPCSP